MTAHAASATLLETSAEQATGTGETWIEVVSLSDATRLVEALTARGVACSLVHGGSHALVRLPKTGEMQRARVAALTRSVRAFVRSWAT